MSVIYNFKENIKKEELDNVAQNIKMGKVVVFPTETVYGIGADATNKEAVDKIFIAKGRPQDNPLIVHISNIKMLNRIAEDVNDIEKKLIENFWPGPMTIILKSKDILPKNVTAGLKTVGIRMPDNDIALSIIESAGVPIAAPSANVSGRPSGTKLEDVYDELKDKVDIFVDGGSTNIGIESTVLKVEEDNTVRILRPGKISIEDILNLGINAKLDEHIFKDVKEGEKVESPGMKHRHYAPKTKTILLEYNSDDSIMINKVKEYISENTNKKVGIICFEEHENEYQKMGIKCITIAKKNNLMGISKNIFSLLRNIDNLDIDLCIVEGVEKKLIGTAIMNRLIRACEYNIL